MNVPPFIPPQIEVTRNVAESPYVVRTAFIRRVVSLHTAFVAMVMGVSLLPLPEANLELGGIIILASLLTLSLVRGVAKGWRHEQVLSSICIPTLVAGLAIAIQDASIRWCPFWVFGVVPAAMLGYSLLCGRDWSFVGMFVIGTLAVTAATLAGYFMGEFSQASAVEVWIVLVSYALFYVYDLAALQTRRRQGEEVGAVLDLFRDLLNFITYPIRVVNHWRRHRIWSTRS